MPKNNKHLSTQKIEQNVKQNDIKIFLIEKFIKEYRRTKKRTRMEKCTT